MEMHDLVNHPAHYTQGPIECIDYIEAQKLGFHEAQVVKYITRWRMKNGLEDLMKAGWYLNRLIAQEKESIPLVEQPLCNCSLGLMGLSHYPCQGHTWGKSPIAEVLEDIREFNGAACQLDGRNCPPACTCQEADDWSEEKCAEPLDIVGNAWTPEIQKEIERENLAAHNDLIQAIADSVGLFESGEDTDLYCLGDFRRGGPGSDWQTRPWINE
jgi:hypothetical protein